MNLKKLLQPQKIAIIGASEKETFGGFTTKIAIENSCHRLNDLYLINPKRQSILGRKTFKSIKDIGEKIDLVVICTPKETVNDLLYEAVQADAKAAIVYASGYSETGTQEGIESENQLKQLCRSLKIELMGPNCAGFINYVDNVFAFGIPIKNKTHAGTVGFVSQSGQICVSLLDDQTTDYSYIISCGNSNIVTIENYLEFLVNDDTTKVVAAYVEGLPNPALFARVLKKAAIKQKPVIILKAGRSEKGIQAASSHTGSLTGSDKAFDALCEKFGVIRVRDMEELLATPQIFASLKAFPKKNAFCAVSISGGETAIASDVGEMYGIQFPDFHSKTIKKLKSILPDFATPRNPLDTTAAICYNADTYASVLRIISDDPNVEMLIIGFTLIEHPEDPAIFYMTEGMENYIKSGANKPIVVLPFIETGRNLKISNRLKAAGIPILPTSQYAYQILKYILKFTEYRHQDKTLTIAPSGKFNGEKIVLSEHTSKKMLKQIDIPVPKEMIAKSEEEAIANAKVIGYPVVLKILSEDIMHKTDIGGVVLNVCNDIEVKVAYKKIMGKTKSYQSAVKSNRILVQKMLPKGLEVIIGVKNDPQFGPVVMLGLGGVFVEIFEDTVLYPAPFNIQEAHNMINALKSKKLFYGFRNSPKLDVDALATTLVAVSEFSVKNKENLIEMDINPLFVYPEGYGVSAADCLIVQGENRSQIQ